MNLKMEDVVSSSGDESVQSDNDVIFEENNDDEQNGNPKLADALAKVIRMGKSKEGKSVVLSKAKLYSPKTVAKKTHGFEIEPDPNKEIKTEDVKPEVDDIKPDKKELKKIRVPKQEKLQRGRLKPSPLDREKEKPLVRIATRGVVQLFNAVRQQQSAINKQINRPGLTESKKEKILKSIDKKAFLDVLKGKTNNIEISNADGSDEEKKPKTEDEDEEEKENEGEEEEPTWQVLRDDFMMGAKLKDWDKKEMEIED